MIEGVKLSQDQIVDRFGVSRRLAVRACALLAKGVGVSAAFLESARAGSPAETLLMLPELLQGAAGLTAEGLKVLAEGKFEESEAPVLVTNGDGERVIALAEEMEADQTELVRSEDTSPTLFSPIGTALRVIGEGEARKLFTPEEISRLKMIILTSADPSGKIEAIRRLALSPLNASDKGIVLIHALGDADASVRVEAAEALSALGLTPGIASAARSLGEGNLQQRVAAAERMGVLAEKVSEAEIGVILTMLAGAINNEDSPQVKKVLIRSFRGACGVVAHSKAYAAELVRLLVRQLEGAPEVLYRPVREILGEVGRRASEMMTELIIGELSVIKAAPLRRLLFGVLATFEVPEEFRAKLARLGVADFEGSETPEEDCKGIGAMLCGWGVTATEPLLAALPDADDAQKIYIVRLIDEIVCRRGGTDAVEQAGTALLDLLRVSDKHVRAPVIETTVISHPSLSHDLKRRIAAELLGSVTEFANPRMRDMIEAAGVRLGESALAAAKQALEEQDGHAKCESACRVIAEIVTNFIDEGKRNRLADDMLAVCLEQWHAVEDKKGYLAETIGRLCVCSSAPPGRLTEIATELKEVVFQTPDPFGVLAALGHISGSAKLDANSRFDVAQTLFDLLDTALPDLTDNVLPSATNDDEEIHHFGSEVAAYTEMIPACLGGLEKIYFGSGAKSLRAKIARFLVQKWHETSDWKTIWGPAALEILMRVLSRIARDSSTDPECAGEIVEAMGERLDFVPVVEEVGKILASDRSSQRVGAAASRIGWKLLKRASVQREPEVRVLLKTLGSLAARTDLGGDPIDARKLREHTLQALYAGLKAGHTEASEALELMKNCPALPAATREEIHARLNILSETTRKHKNSSDPL